MSIPCEIRRRSSEFGEVDDVVAPEDADDSEVGVDASEDGESWRTSETASPIVRSDPLGCFRVISA